MHVSEYFEFWFDWPKTCMSALAIFGSGRVILKTGVDVQAAYIFSYPSDLTLTRASCSTYVSTPEQT